MNFRDWILEEEKPTRIVGSTDPTTMSGVWDRMSPGNPAQNLVDMNEVWNLVRKLSNDKINEMWMRMVVEGLRIPEVTVYQNTLDKMVKIDGIIGVIEGRISNQVAFSCDSGKFQDRNASIVTIAPPPCRYDNKERAVLASCVIHELRHAIDVHEIDVSIDHTRDMGSHYEMDMDLYARNVYEARAWADQTKAIVNFLGGERAKEALRKSILAGGFIPSLLESMLELVDLICAGKNESIENPPAIVVRDENKVYQAVELVRRIVESFNFSRFVRPPRN